MNKLQRLTAVAAVAAGFLLGILTTGEARATTYQYQVWNYPGAGATIYCGWHGQCDSTNSNMDGDSLDWGNASGSPVYWRSLSANTQNLSYRDDHGHGLEQRELPYDLR